MNKNMKQEYFFPEFLLAFDTVMKLDFSATSSHLTKTAR